MSEFLSMGGYAVWVWGAYGVATVGIVGLLISTLATLRARQREFDALKSARGRGDA
ncbi:MAG: heme exporter protein CcmD [Rhodospirillaceae bacterium]